MRGDGALKANQLGTVGNKFTAGLQQTFCDVGGIFN